MCVINSPSVKIAIKMFVNNFYTQSVRNIPHNQGLTI